ncbi:attractin-like protein 1 [Amphiura filiformis]|uniref:attractin-like protein 1 n=1 Tax=Amphiura filiformis TaxID=82378 RepID=UPI003B227537
MMEETLSSCFCKAIFPESHRLRLDRFHGTELWKSGRLRCERMRIGFSSPSQVCVLLLLILGSFPSTALASCTGLGRSVLTDLQGTITDGDGKYPEDEHCEWLILAPSPNMKIQLTFKHFSTECSYDYLSIFDGDSFSSPKIATFSGDRTPLPVVASSGKMLIYLYSDTNYNLNGTEATYVIQNCTNNCSGHGTCDEVTHTCNCNTWYIGEACEYSACPNDCGNDGNGACDQTAMVSFVGVCMGHGTCDEVTHTCNCNTWYIERHVNTAHVPMTVVMTVMAHVIKLLW